jgi:hypothetical protein
MRRAASAARGVDRGVADDLRFAVRSRARTPGAAAAIICTLVLGPA